MATRIYKAQNGQTLYDVCLMTYGTLDNLGNSGQSALFKLMKDNAIPGVDSYPVAGQSFSWDDTLVFDENVNITNSVAKVNYATRASNTGGVYYDIKENGKPSNPGIVGPVTPPPTPGDGLGYFYVYAGDPGISADLSGNFVYTDARLKGLTGYAVYATQFPDMLNDIPPGLTYDPVAGSFTFGLADFAIVAGYRLVVFTNLISL